MKNAFGEWFVNFCRKHFYFIGFFTKLCGGLEVKNYPKE